ncbi:hypothetical protein ACFYOF_17085 [Streptomyces sp. NPDC007148]|uniref:hypothetical protein n=1 Tax=Streptomyces sp. NPDC007148 TaxID=3364775 RepID=UPI003677A414
MAVEESRREQILALVDPALPPPDFGSLPTAEDTEVAVYACGSHAITMDLASLVHASTCTAPNNENLPACDCTPEPPPEPSPYVERSVALPDHWQ